MSGAAPLAGAGAVRPLGLRADADALAPRLTALRRDLHRHPELAFEEHRTAGVVAARLRELGLQPRVGVGGTGVVALLEGARPGKTVLLRADMDALPVTEVAGRAYGSERPGAMHACGHDGHTAILLGAAELLVGRRDALAGRVLLVFQPAEEIVRGARAMLDDGALDGLQPDHALGLHLSSNHPCGTVALRAGPAMAATDAFDLRVLGRGGHAALPHQARDPIVAAAQLASALQTLVARERDPLRAAVISLTAIQGGGAYNVIPEEVTLKGTLRTFEPELRDHLRQRILALAEGVAGALGCGFEHSWHEGTPAVVNDAAATARVRALAEAVVGPERVVEDDAMMGGDDMALWLQRAPGCYFFLGAADAERGIDKPHHHPGFDLDERALPLGAALLAEGAVLLAGDFGATAAPR